jgi:nicotinic acid mononucleotide adenylyltransferase
MNKGVYIIATGGGSLAISSILTAGGASSYFVGADLPYHESMFSNIVGEVWDGKMVSERSAHQLAAAAFDKAKIACDTPLGIGVTASLCKATGERVGRDNHAHIAIVYKDGDGLMAMTRYVGFDSAQKDRAFQEMKLAMSIREVVHGFIKGRSIPHSTYYSQLVNGVNGSKWMPNAYPEDAKVIPIMSGSYNPIHEGHVEMYKKVMDFFQVEPLIEIPLTHHNKASISPYEFQARRKLIDQVIANPIVTAGEHPLYIDKAAYYQSVFPGKKIVFVMGADVYRKIDTMHKLSINMLVFGRSGDSVMHPNAIIHNMEIESQHSSTDIRAAERWIKKR